LTRACKRLLGRAGLWLLAAVLLWAALHDLDWRSVWSVLTGLTTVQIGVLAAVNLGIVLLLGTRWWLILRGLGAPIGLLRAAGYRLVAFGVSYFTPGPHFGGEPLQVALAVRRDGVRTGTAAAAVILDRLIEMSANFAFLGAGVYALIAEGLVTGRAASAGLFAAAGLLGFPVFYLAALAAGRRPIGALAQRLPGLDRKAFLKELQALIDAAEAQAEALIRGRKNVFVLAVLLSAVIWAALILEFALAIRFLGLDFNLQQVIGVIAAARLAILLPVPAGLGSLEAALVLVSQALGEPAAVGVGLSMLVRVRDTGFALAGLWLGRTWFDGSAKSMENGNASSPP